MNASTKAWKTYEEVAQCLLERFGDQFGIGKVEGKQLVPGATGTNWEIDAKAFQAEGTGFLIVECRRYTTSRLDQESLGALAYRIHDSGAAGGIVVSPLRLQEGAARVAFAEGIQSLCLTPISSTTDYVLAFLNQTFLGVSETVAIGESVATVHMRNGKVVP